MAMSPISLAPLMTPRGGPMGMVFDIKNKKETPFALKGSKGELRFGYISIEVK